jgi:hypothetical protein
MPSSGQTFNLSPSTQTVAVGVNATITITVQDLSIAPANPPATTQYYSLWDGTGTGTFTPSFGTVLAGGQTGTFTYRNTNPGTYTIYVTEVSSMVTHTVTVIVTAGSPPSPTSFTLTPASQTAAQGVATGDYTIELFNGSSPAVAGGGGQAFSLSSSDAGGTFSTGATATVPAGSSSVTFTYTSPNEGTAILTATASGSPYSVNVHTALAVISTSGGSGGSGGSLHMAGNPQSGRQSVVGLAIESAFRSVPLTLLSGSTYNAGITGTNPMRFFTVEPGGGFDTDAIKEVGVDEQDGDSEIHRVTLTGKTYPGKDTAKLDPENLYYPLLGCLGRDVETTLAAGAYKHVFTPTVRNMPSFSMEEQYGDKTSGRLSSGVIIPGLHITHGAVLQWQADYYGHRQIPNRYPAAGGLDVDYDFTSVAGLLPSQLGGDHTKQVKLNLAPTSVDVAEGNCGNGPLVHAGARTGSAAGFSTGYVTLNDVIYDAKIQPGWTLDILRDIESHMTAGSGYDPTDPVANVVNVSGKMDFLFTDNTITEAMLSNCKFGINIQYVGAQIGATGYYYSYEVYLPRVKLIKAPVTRQAKTMMVNATFQAEYDPSLAFSVKVTLQNSFTHATLAGGTASYSGGGLSGWSSS